MTAGSPLTLAVRSNARPAWAARAAASMSRSYSTSRWSATNPQAHTITPPTSPRRAQLVDHLQDVRADPRLGRATGRLPRDRPVGRLRRGPSALGHRHGGRAELVGIRVAGVDDALRQRVGGEQHPDVATRSTPSSRRAVRRGRRRGTRRRPARSPNSRCRSPAPSRRRRLGSGRGTRRSSTTSSAARAPARRWSPHRTPTAAAAATSTLGSACFMPSDTTKRPGARSSSERCRAWRWASVTSASGDTPPMAT